ncbi:biotin--[acetyl-CoA-carboxylase] ligase [Halalkalicoccus jeotgali]|uniref:Biotin--[acetyl-CoA-carboxylase] ligase n=1 Tax=Halalkalicoccus jeotgali (strain DSM 18796 / CECT 7217 / JCM 14584 / KCTC 4019 / B3) TaxID=795797 RepID=D8JAQ9_HALJB|nr:biotin--[acetyl-CoA-carboxylase] ligase [Halalkalicoccus jeotgali]ADJ14781.1 biotin--[acetyl-CoA-carboxylase] ligase [Halalkalicoccus jeotgali B3]ELY39363.1 biotin--acetyl-CoA-carboxylase ligase [Halalkalicoccus jeotgali B3]
METRKALCDALASGPVSGPDLAEELGVSRNAVWKQVEELRESGFEIESTDAGYRVVSVPEFCGSAVEYGLDAPYEIEYHEAIDSTNARARELAKAGAGRVAVLAGEQTAGRGRLERAWSAPSGGIYLSIVLRPTMTPMQAPLLTLAGAVATTRALREAGVDAGIKWPNDILLASSGEKLVGILTEMEGEADRVSWVVCGIGVNANVDAAALPEGATSVREQVGDIDRRVFTQRLLEEFTTLRADPDAILDRWREHALTLGQRVRVETGAGDVVGRALDIESPGRLVIGTDEGEVRVHAGDCEHLRPV